MIASKGARGCFARAMHNGVNNGTNAVENSERRAVILSRLSRGAAQDGEGSQDAQVWPEARGIQCGFGKLEILRRPAPFRRFATPGSGGSG